MRFNRFNVTYVSTALAGAWTSFATRATLLPPITKRLTAPQLRAVKSWPRWGASSSRAVMVDFNGLQVFDFNATFAAQCAVWDELQAYNLKIGSAFPDLFPSPPPLPPSSRWSQPPKRRYLPPPKSSSWKR
jgi:hypothetical protein